jgi:hypothetical protein
MFADYAYDRFIEKGYSPHAAAAAVGAFQQESGKDLDPLAVHDEGTGMGIAGWRDVEPGVGRKTNLINWAKQNNLDPNDIDTQLDYFDYEINDGEERGVGDQLRNAETLDDAVAAMVHYERPQGYDQNDITKASGYDNRLNNAKALFDSYTGSDALAQDTRALDPEAMQEVELDEYPEDEEEYDDEAYEDEEPTDRERVGQALLSAGRKMQDQTNEPLDYTPAGENMEVEESYDQGIPVNQYQQYTAAYADGGVVGEMDINEYFRMLGV